MEELGLFLSCGLVGGELQLLSAGEQGDAGSALRRNCGTHSQDHTVSRMRVYL